MTPVTDDASVVEAREMRLEWSSESGPMLLTFPSHLSPADIDDFEALVRVAVAGMRRRAALVVGEG